LAPSTIPFLFSHIAQRYFAPLPRLPEQPTIDLCYQKWFSGVRNIAMVSLDLYDLCFGDFTWLVSQFRSLKIFTLPANRAGTVQALLETNEETWLQTPDKTGSSPINETVKKAGPEVFLRIQN